MSVKLYILLFWVGLFCVDLQAQPVIQEADKESEFLERFAGHVLQAFAFEDCCDTDSLQIPIPELLKVMHWPDDPATVKQMQGLMETDNRILRGRLLELRQSTRKFQWAKARILRSELKLDPSNRLYCNILVSFQEGKHQIDLDFSQVYVTPSGFFLRSTSGMQVRN